MAARSDTATASASGDVAFLSSEALRDPLRNFCAVLAAMEDPSRLPPDIRELIARAAVTIYGNCPAKMKEVLAAADSNGALTVVDGNHGADAWDERRGCPVELKSSIVTKKRAACSVLLAGKKTGMGRTSIARGLCSKLCESPEDEKALLQAGYMHVQISRPDGTIKKEYRVAGSLLIGYFSLSPDLDRRKEYSLGCGECKDCGEYHRIKKFADVRSVDMPDNHVNAAVSVELCEWLRERTPRHCGNVPMVFPDVPVAAAAVAPPPSKPYQRRKAPK